MHRPHVLKAASWKANNFLIFMLCIVVTADALIVSRPQEDNGKDYVTKSERAFLIAKCLAQHSGTLDHLQAKLADIGIWIGPYDFAFQPSILGRALRSLGIRTTVMTEQHPFGDFADLHLDQCNVTCRRRLIQTHGIFHIHELEPFGQGTMEYLHSVGKCIVVQTHGSYFRPIDKWRLTSLGHYNEPDAHLLEMGLGFPGEEVRARYRHVDRFADLLAGHDEEMISHWEHDVLLPRYLNLSLYPFAGLKKEPHKLLVLHSPSNRAVKYSDHIEKVMAELATELNGQVDFEFRELHKVTHEVVQQSLIDADIVIDQLRVGHYGVFAQESMARGKAVIVYIKDDIRDRVIGVDPKRWPLVPSSAYELKDDLRRLLLDGVERQRLSVAARRFVEQKHDVSNHVLFILKMLDCACIQHKRPVVNPLPSVGLRLG